MKYYLYTLYASGRLRKKLYKVCEYRLYRTIKI